MMTVFISIALALLFGLLFTRLTNLFKLPDVTAYLIAGVLIGPYCLGRLGIPGIGFTDFQQLDNVGFLSDLALGFIAFAIGSEFKASALKQTGKQALVIGVLQAVITALVVDAVLIGVHLIVGEKLSLAAAITLGAIAAATAPAATLMVIRQYKARGKVTSVLLPVVALDDAVGLALFAVSFGIAKALKGGAVDVWSVAVSPLVEIVASLALGAVLGLGLTLVERLFHSNRNRTAVSIAFIMASVALSMLKFPVGPVTVGFSPLLVCMMLGTVFCNVAPLADEIMDLTDRWSAPLLALFFVLSGADLELGVFSDLAVVGVGAAYILSRCVGKYLGAHVSSVLVRAEPEVKKYLGITLFPQAGVALGMCVTAATLPGDGAIIRNIVLFAVLIYELVGPMLTKIALTKSGDIVAPAETGAARRAKKLEERRG